MDIENNYNNIKGVLTKTQFRILPFLLSKQSTTEIAQVFFITDNGVRKHSSNICDRLEIRGGREELKEELKWFRHDPQYLDDLKKIVSLSYEKNDPLNVFMEDFEHTLKAMFNNDFTKRIHVSDNEQSFLHLVAEGINSINENFENDYFFRDHIDKKHIEGLLEVAEVKNRIFVISKDNETIDELITTSKSIVYRPDQLINMPLKSLFSNSDFKWTSKFKVHLNRQFFPNNYQKPSTIKYIQKDGMSVISIVIYPEYLLSDLLPRILTLLASMKDQMDDNGPVYKSIIGSYLFHEVNDIHHALKDYILDFKSSSL